MQELLTREERDRLTERLLPGEKSCGRGNPAVDGGEGPRRNGRERCSWFLCRGMGEGMLHGGVRSGLDG